MWSSDTAAEPATSQRPGATTRRQRTSSPPKETISLSGESSGKASRRSATTLKMPFVILHNIVANTQCADAEAILVLTLLGHVKD